MIRECNIRNYSIFHKDGLLFAYFEYVGDDFDADMAKMAADPETQDWWDIMMPMQAAPGDPRRGRVVGRHGRGVSHRLGAMRWRADRMATRTNDRTVWPSWTG